MRDIVAIVGSHPISRAKMDFNRTDCDIWIFNEAHNQEWATRYDAVFQIHSPIIFKNDKNRNCPEHYQWLQTAGDYQIYMQEQYPEIPNAVKFPLDEVCQELLGDKLDRRYFTSSPAYAIALAIYQGYKRIEIYGVEMETNTEYRHQRDGITFWIGMAVGRGIPVDLHSHQLLNSPLYGYEGDARIDKADFERRLEELEKTCKKHQDEYSLHEPIVQKAIAGFASKQVPPEAVVKVIQEQVAAAHNFGLADGAKQENERYLAKIKHMEEQFEGEYFIVMQEYDQAMGALSKKKAEQMAVVNTVATDLEKQFQKATEAKNTTLRRTRMQKFSEIHQAYIRESVKLGLYNGAAIENKMLMDRMDQLIRMAGGEASKEVLTQAYAEAVA